MLFLQYGGGLTWQWRRVKIEMSVWKCEGKLTSILTVHTIRFTLPPFSLLCKVIESEGRKSVLGCSGM